jgi:transcriptional regulator with PAS, ATPase and Fis domain
VGRFEAAQGGTVFLDEIGELSPRIQARLLEFLQSRTISPIGSGKEIKLDVRVIAATHRNLPERVRNGEFREDLFHRLRVLSITLKGLRERSEKFGQLVHACLEEICLQRGHKILQLSEEFADQLERYSWPGNEMCSNMR